MSTRINTIFSMLSPENTPQRPSVVTGFVSEDRHTWTGHLKLDPYGVDNIRILTEKEMQALRKLASEDSDNPLLEDFAGFFAASLVADILKPRDFSLVRKQESMRRLGSLAAHWVLAIRESASADQWSEDCSPPGVIFDEVEKWLEDEHTKGFSVNGLTVKQFLFQESPPE